MTGENYTGCTVLLGPSSHLIGWAAGCSKLRYYRKFVPEGMSEVKLFGVFDSTANDSDDHVYRCVAMSSSAIGCICASIYL